MSDSPETLGNGFSNNTPEPYYITLFGTLSGLFSFSSEFSLGLKDSALQAFSVLCLSLQDIIII